VRERVVVYCDDCPIRWMCDPDEPRFGGKDCDYTRHIHKVVEEAPPLTQEQIDKIVTLLRG
jgi:hypothetical protein